MKKILILLSLVLPLFSADLPKITFEDLIIMYSKSTNQNFVIDDKVKDKSVSLFLSDKADAKVIRSAIDVVCKQYNLKMVKDRGVYSFISIDTNTSLPDPPAQYYFYNLRFLSYDDIKEILALYNIDHKYLPSNNSILLRTDDVNYHEVLNYIKSVDLLDPQSKLKITIFETNTNKLKDFGLNTQANLLLSDNLFINFLSYPFSSATNLQDSNIYPTLKLLQTEGISKILTSPIVTVRHNKETLFDKTVNLPFLVQQNDIQNQTTTNTVSSYEYKDVGIKILLKPFFLGDVLDLNLDLQIQDVLTDDITPTTSNIKIKQSFILRKGDKLLLSGINKNTDSEDTDKIPYLSDLPIIGLLFTNYSTNNQFNQVTIIIEFPKDGSGSAQALQTVPLTNYNSYSSKSSDMFGRH